MRDELAHMKPHKIESGIVNLNRSFEVGSHWTAFCKHFQRVIFFDPFGLRPPPEIVNYFVGSQLFYSNEKLQRYDASDCGKLCLEFLIKETAK